MSEAALVAPASAPSGLHFRADRAVLSPGSAQLSGGVVVSASRWRLQAERLELRAGSGGEHELIGPLELRPCPCAGAPLTLGVGEARLRLDDQGLDVVTVRDATVRLGGLPVLYLPWWQLRSERRWGLLAPRAALRARDGWLFGAGVHAPVAAGVWLELEPALYLRGGHELLARARLGEGELRARWDHRGADLLALQGQGRASPREGLVAWSIDARRGARARAATIEIDDASRVNDRAAVALVLPWGGAFATGVRASAQRGQGAWAAGPRTSWAGGSRGGLASWLLDASILQREGAGASSALRTELEASQPWWWGPLRVVPGARALGGLVARPDGAEAAGALVAGVRVEAPLVRAGEAAQQRLEPGIWLGALASGQRGAPASWVLPSLPAGASGLAAARVRSAWAWPSGGLVVARGLGGALASPEGLRPAARALLQGEAGWASAWADGAASGARDAVLSAGARLGEARGFALTARVEEQRGEAPTAVRLLDGASTWLGGWYDGPGWSAEGGVEAPLVGGLRAGAWGWASLAGPGWLGERMALLYNHPCGCLGAGAYVARRLGREGTDVWLSLSLS